MEPIKAETPAPTSLFDILGDIFRQDEKTTAEEPFDDDLYEKYLSDEEEYMRQIEVAMGLGAY